MGNSNSTIITKTLLRRIVISPRLFKAKIDCEKYQFKSVPKDSSKCGTGSKDAAKAPKQPPKFPVSNTWRKITFLLVLPALAGVAAYVFKNKEEHPRPEFVPYSYLRLRNKRFPWGDGTKSLFHNPRVNPLPDGYEDEQ